MNFLNKTFKLKYVQSYYNILYEYFTIFVIYNLYYNFNTVQLQYFIISKYEKRTYFMRKNRTLIFVLVPE